RCQKGYQRTRRMAEHEKGRPAVGQHHLLEELVEIGGILAEAADIALSRILEQAVRPALTAPVEDRRAETPGGKIADRLEIFFDALVAALKDDDRALERPAFGGEAGIADAAAVRRGHQAGDGVRGNGVSRRCEEEI